MKASAGLLFFLCVWLSPLAVDLVWGATRNFQAATTGDWALAANWVEGSVPDNGDDVYITYTGSLAIISSASSNLSSLTVGGGATSTRLMFTNWNSILTATYISILTNGVVTLPAAFTNGQMSNNVYFFCSNLTIAPGGKIDVTGQGYAGGTNSDGHGPGFGRGGSSYWPSGAGHGGAGGDQKRASAYPWLAGGSTYDQYDAPTFPGSGGGGGATGCKGGNGGGAVIIESVGTVTVNGTIAAGGTKGTFGSGDYYSGGSGGSIFIRCYLLAGSNGIISANGGAQGEYGGSGGGGRIAVIYTNSAQEAAAIPAITFSAAPGLNQGNATPWPLTARQVGSGEDPSCQYNNAYGRLGTLYFPSSRFLQETNWHSGLWLAPVTSPWIVNSLTQTGGYLKIAQDGLVITANQITVTSGGRLELSNAMVTCLGDFLITNGAFALLAGMTTRPNVTISSNLSVLGSSSSNSGLFYIQAGETNSTFRTGAVVSVNGNVTIGTNGWISPLSNPTNGGSVFFSMSNLTINTPNCGFRADGAGFRERSDGSVGANGYGPGRGVGGQVANRNSGASYGGTGGVANSGTVLPGPVYGSSNAPFEPGSAGGSGSAYGRWGGRGGGFIWVRVEDTLTLNGVLSANGGPIYDGAYGGGGSGGAINLYCRRFVIGGANAVVRANGGNTGYSGGLSGSGGGGRIAIWSMYREGTMVSPAVNAGGSDAAAGSVHWGQVPVPGSILSFH
ncbi:MAG: hypothetical protein HYV35_01280 [Lentisphaerae bacterium]|nr:hypothetical protein [Lentisphaerota bacterium]